MNENQVKHFWSKVNIKDDFKQCWEWMGAKKTNGYGNVRINSTYHLAHRVAWELSNFKIPDGYQVMHICDNPKCCNPNHLVLGGNRTNFCDMLFKNRSEFSKNKAVGSFNGNSKLDDKKVSEIIKSYENKEMNQYELAHKYSVSQPTIMNIVNNKTWKHIERKIK